MQESNLEAFKTAILGKVSDNQLVEVWMKLLTQLIEDIERYQLLRSNKLNVKLISSNLNLFKIKWQIVNLKLNLMSFSYPTPELEGRSNLTSLDIQIKKLRDNTLKAIKDGARRMREEAIEIRDTLTDIEIWAVKLKALAEEVQIQQQNYCPKMKEVLSDLVCWNYIVLHRCRCSNYSWCILLLCSAPEQHAWCDHLDAAWWEEGGLQPHPCSPGSLLHLQWAGLWTTLWQDANHLFKRTCTV